MAAKEKTADKWTAERWNKIFGSLAIGACITGLVLIVAAGKFGFDAYYDAMVSRTVGEQQARYDDLQELHETRAAWNGQLERGNRMSIEAAMNQLGSRGRNGFPEIRPQAGDMSLDALEGWNQLPQEVVEPEPEREPALPAHGRLSPEALQQLRQALRGIRPAGSPE